MNVAYRRVLGIALCFVALFFTIWFELFVQKRHYLIGGGINRAFLFLLINAHVIVIILLLYLIIRQSIKLFFERRKGAAGSVFKRNLLFAFILFSVIPSFFVFFTAGKFITQSIDRWFQAHLEHGLQAALRLHELTTSKLRGTMQQDGERLARFLQKNGWADVLEKATEKKVESLALALDNYMRARALDEKYDVYVWREDGVELIGSIQDEVAVWRSMRMRNDRTMKSVKDIFCRELGNDQATGRCFDFYGSLYWRKKIGQNMCVLVYRYDAAVQQSLIGLQSSLLDCTMLSSISHSIYMNYFFTFLLITLLILFLSIWCAFYLARGITKPIQELLDATEKIRQGQWDCQVEINLSSDLQSLAHGFNEMTAAVRQAHNYLELKHKETLAILENISAAVFFMSTSGRIVFYNAAAQKLVSHYLGSEVGSCIQGKRISMFGPAVLARAKQFIREWQASHLEYYSRELSFHFASEPRTFVIFGRMLFVAQGAQALSNGILVVIEDVTDLVKVNKIKTWQEAAKQMAHEIKNPLTPIQLATQRLQRKFGDVLKSDAIFWDCTDTILSQVAIIKDLVTHFSQFASMPALSIEIVDLKELVDQVLCLYQVSYPNIHFVCKATTDKVIIKTDAEKLKLVFINLLDNSVRAMCSYQASLTNRVANEKMVPRHEITISLIPDQLGEVVAILFADSGPGIPASVKETLFLPYVSTDQKNMGLGLAIVHDIVTQLGGKIALRPSCQGAVFFIQLPI